MLNSQRDGAAYALRMVCSKYVAKLRWRIDIHPDGTCSCTENAFASSAESVLHFVRQLVAIISSELETRAANLGVVHGIMLALRYIMNDTDFETPEMRALRDDWRSVMKQVCVFKYRFLMRFQLLPLLHQTDAVALARFTQSGPDGEPVMGMDGALYDNITVYLCICMLIRV